jgi:hypothetical protein
MNECITFSVSKERCHVENDRLISLSSLSNSSSHHLNHFYWLYHSFIIIMSMMTPYIRPINEMEILLSEVYVSLFATCITICITIRCHVFVILQSSLRCVCYMIISYQQLEAIEWNINNEIPISR